MAALPQQGQLIVPIDWQGSTSNISMNVGSYRLVGTIGWRPCKETATLTWHLTVDESAALLAEFQATNMNGVYTYTHQQRGNIRIRLTGPYSVQEVTDAGGWIKYVVLSVGVETV